MCLSKAEHKAICDVPALQIGIGNKPTDGGLLFIAGRKMRHYFQQRPQAAAFIRPYMMGKDFINRKPRYCLWLVGVSPSQINKCPNVRKSIEQVQKYRLSSRKAATRKKAETPMLFDEVRECQTDYIAIPKVSSENRTIYTNGVSLKRNYSWRQVVYDCKTHRSMILGF